MTDETGLAVDLVRAVSDAPDHVNELHERPAAAARVQGVLDVGYRTLDSPVGSLLLAATELGLVRVAFSCEDHDAVLGDLSARISPRIFPDTARLDDAARELEQYFVGRRRMFEVALDWRLSSGFRGSVLHRLPEIAFGRTATYAAVARLSGNPGAVRAVGTACATNPLPIVVPCHRVVRSDGGMGGYLGGVEAKRALLSLEAAA